MVLAGNSYVYCLACHLDLRPDHAEVTKFVDASAKFLLIADFVAREDLLAV